MIRYLAFMLLTCGCVFHASATLVNGNFDSGLSGWNTVGGVSSSGGVATLNDASGGADLTQAFLLGPGQYQLSFEFNAVDLTASPQFDDLFTATFYALDAPGGILPSDPLAAAAEVIPLLDLTAEASLVYGGSILPIGAEWFRYTFTFTHNHTAGYLEFLLTGFDALDGNSSIQLDNIALTQSTDPVVPEPIHLGVLGLLLAGGLRKRLKTSG